MQLNLKTRPVFAVLILIFGLVSCSEEKPGPGETFKISPPKLVEPGQKELSWLEVQKQKTLALSNLARIEFGPEIQQQSASVTVRSRCLINKMQVSGESRLQRPGSLHLIQLLPREVLLAAPGQAVQCAFDFTAANPQGSKHHFFLPDVAMTTQTQGTGLRIKKDGLILEPAEDRAHQITPAQMSHYLAIRSTKGSDLRLVCEKHEIGASNANSAAVSFQDFDSSLAHALDGDNLPLDLFPRQNCRFTEVQNGEYGLFSDLLQIDFERRRLEVLWRDSSVLLEQTGFNFGQAYIRNTSDRPVDLKLPAAGAQRLHIRRLNGFLVDYSIGVRFDLVGAKGNSGSIRLDPGEDLTLKVVGTQRVTCVPDRLVSQEIQVHMDWVWAKTGIGPEWVQVDEKRPALPSAGKSNGVVSVFPHTFERPRAYSLKTFEVEWEKVKDQAPTPGTQCRYF